MKFTEVGTSVCYLMYVRAALLLAPSFALAEPRLVGEQNVLGLGVWARCADSMRVLRSQVSTPRLVVAARLVQGLILKTRARA